MIDEIKKNIDLDMNTVDAIAIAGGPGSYTGLRIGSATAKGFGLALNIPIINIPTMDALAYNLFSSSFVICLLWMQEENRFTQEFTSLTVQQWKL